MDKLLPPLGSLASIVANHPGFVPGAVTLLAGTVRGDIGRRPKMTVLAMHPSAVEPRMLAVWEKLYMFGIEASLHLTAMVAVVTRGNGAVDRFINEAMNGVVADPSVAGGVNPAFP